MPVSVPTTSWYRTRTCVDVAEIVPVDERRWKLLNVPSWNSSGLLPAFLVMETPVIDCAQPPRAPSRSNPTTSTTRLTSVQVQVDLDVIAPSPSVVALPTT